VRSVTESECKVGQDAIAGKNTAVIHSEQCVLPRNLKVISFEA
jgi:hypothetical protein